MSKTNSRWPYLTPGIPDTLFRREPGIPLTKEEVRVLTLAKARLFSGHIVYDIGSGTGSLTVEAALLVRPGLVYAIEKKPASMALTQANVRDFALDNVLTISGTAPQALTALPAPDRVLVGGSGGELAAILTVCWSRLKPGGRIVVNAVTWDTLRSGIEWALTHGLTPEVTRIGVDRLTSVGEGRLWRSLNGVYVITIARSD